MLSLYNTLSKKVEEFRPLKKGKVGMYSCGPTVYDYAHLGNLRAYIFVDLLKRYLKFSGYEVLHVSNITDVDDKTIKRSQKENKPLKEITDFYYQKFLEDIKSVNILLPDITPRATEHINEMVAMIQSLLDKGYAYKLDGSVYFSINKFPKYGELAGLENVKKENLKTGVSDEYTKEDVRDFALWKGWDEKDGEVFWETPLGKGRPGWHIECSAMSTKYLGESFDIHCGGVDLIFPHHTNEIAQTEGVTGKSFVKYWLHNEHLLIEGEKMSKSLNNFTTLKNLTDEGVNPILVRIQLIKSHYRQRLNFTKSGLEEAKSIATRVSKTFNLLDEADSTVPNKLEVEETIKENEKLFMDAMDNDLNISEAFAILFQIMEYIEKNEGALTKEQADKLHAYLDRLDSVFGFMQIVHKQYIAKLDEAKEDSELKALMGQREQARENKNYKEADRIRKLIEDKGYIVKDSQNKTTLDILAPF